MNKNNNFQRVYVTKLFSFEAAHHLPNYSGPCVHIHGHSYKLQVTVSALNNYTKEYNPDIHTASSYMVLDFKALKEAVNKVILKYDHCYLNDYFDVPTAEAMAVSIFNDIDSKLLFYKDRVFGFRLEEVKLWETEDSFVSYRGETYEPTGKR